MFTAIKNYIKRAAVYVFLKKEMAALESAFVSLKAKVEPVVIAEAQQLKADVQLEMAKAKMALAHLRAGAEVEYANAKAEVAALEAKLKVEVKKVV